MEKPLGFSDAVASGSIKRISSFFIYMGFKSVDWIKVIKNKMAQFENLGELVKNTIFVA